MAKLRGLGVIVETDEVIETFQSLRQSTREQVAELARKSLQAQVDAINAAATNRKSALDEADIVSPGTIDQPLASARVVVSESGDKIVVKVIHRNKQGVNVFDVLDAGAPARQMKKRAIFPRYEGNVTPNVVSGDPVAIQANTGKVSIERDAKGGVLMAATKRVSGFQGRHFYEAAAEYAENQIRNMRIVNPKRRSRLRLRAGDVTVRVVKLG